MKKILYTASYLDEGRLDRNIKYVNYYKTIQGNLKFDEIWMCDNASSFENLEKLGGTVISPDEKILINGSTDLIITRFDEHLPRKSMFDYPYCWRSLYHLRDLTKRGVADRFLCIDSDAFVLSQRFIDYLNKTTGWEAAWCEMYGFPEAALNVINQDAFKIIDEYCINDFYHYNGRTMEIAVPYTKIEKGFIGDRFSEKGLTTQDPSWDYCCQTTIDMQMKFNG